MSIEDQNQELDDAFCAMEVAKAKFEKAQQEYLQAQWEWFELYKNSESYKAWKAREWGNRGVDDA